MSNEDLIERNEKKIANLKEKIAAIEIPQGLDPDKEEYFEYVDAVERKEVYEKVLKEREDKVKELKK